MNDAILRQLKIVVERAVRPVRASGALKRRMREELLGHLAAIYEEEAQKTGNPQTAIQRTQVRFGDPRELSQQLAGTVRGWDRLRSIAEWYYDLRPGKTSLQCAARTGMATALGYVVALLIGLLLSFFTAPFTGQKPDVATIVPVVLTIGAVSAIFTLVLHYFSLQIARALHGGESQRSRWASWSYLAASLAILPGFAFAIYWSLSGDLFGSLRHLLFGCSFAPLIPVLFMLMSRELAEELRYVEEWASLEVEDL